MSILKGNQEADRICKKIHLILNVDQNNPFNLSTSIYKNEILSDISFKQLINQAFKEQITKDWIKSKRANFLLENQIDLDLTYSNKFSLYHDMLQHNSQKLIFTKERAFNYYTKDRNLPINIKQKLERAYSNPYCNLCNPLTIDNHDHGNNNCAISLKLHDFLNETIYKILRANSKNPNDPIKSTPRWFSISENSNTPSFIINETFLPFGNKGFIPKKLSPFLKALKIKNKEQVLSTIIELTQTIMVKKWKIKRINIYHPNLDIDEIIEKNLLIIKETFKINFI